MKYTYAMVILILLMNRLFAFKVEKPGKVQKTNKNKLSF